MGLIAGILNVLNPLGKLVATVANETTVRLGVTLKYSKDVMTTAMNHNIYWYAWGIAAFSSVGWYAAVMLDTITNGRTPDVAMIPPSVQPYFDIVWENIFWTGAAGYGIHTAGRILERVLGKR